MKSASKIYFILFLVFLATEGFAQIDPQISQPWMRQMLFNPASMEKSDGYNVYALVREQWTGFDNAPSTQVIGGSKYFRDFNSGLALSLINNTTGVTSFQNIKLNYAYDFNLNEDINMTLAAGMGILRHQTNGSDLVYEEPNDPVALTYDESQTKADFDFGFQLNYNNISAGVAALHLTRSTKNSDIFETPRHYFFHMDYLIDLGSEFYLNPGIMARKSSNAYSYGISALAGYGDLILAGVDYRINEAIAIVAQIAVHEQIRVAYSYDIVTGAANSYSGGTHEISIQGSLGAGFNMLKSPRFFD